jgi:hypothetical protein
LFLIAAFGAASCSHSSSSSGGGGGPVAGEDIVINEFASSGSTEWLELGNKGTTPFDLGGFGVCDTDKNTGQPKTKDALHFPPGTMLAAGGWLLVMTGKKGQAIGPYDTASCLPGASTCFYASFGVSAGSGESVHFLAQDNSVVWSTPYPKEVAIPAKTDTACRLPDFTGNFALCRATPGAANAAP